MPYGAKRLRVEQAAIRLAAAVNPYLNTPPTELRRRLESEKDPGKKKQMKDALNAWRLTTPGPFRKGGCGRGGRVEDRERPYGKGL